MRPPTRSFRRAYTLIEILVAVSVIATIMGIALPAFTAIRRSALRTECLNKLRQVAHAALQYHDKNDRLPYAATMPYAKPATTPGLTDASGIPPGEMLRDLLGPILDSPTRKSSDPRYPFGPNWAVYLLPYVSQASLYQQAQVGDYEKYYKPDQGILGLPILPGVGGSLLGDTILFPKDADTAKRDAWRAVVQDKIIPAYRCPADEIKAPYEGLPDCPGPWARGNYAASAGPGWWQMSLKGGAYREAFGMAGPAMGINFGAQLKDVADGASNTIILNEIRSGVAAKDPRGAWAMGYPGHSITASNAIGDCMTPNDRGETSDDVEGCPKFYYIGIGSRDRIGCSTGFANLGWPSWQAQARSLHREGVHAAFGDGSVRFIHDFITQATWFSMLSTRDGVAFTYD